MSFVAKKEIRDARRAVCAACPDVIKNKQEKPVRCSRCGCPLVSKIVIAGARCPAGKW